MTGQNVALRKESVDRNCADLRLVAPLNASLSARRAWIEIVKYLGDIDWTKVALRKESVDRNSNTVLFESPICESLSARRAWIEMHHGGIDTKHPTVALRKESVDRNGTCTFTDFWKLVALRKESVDRNSASRIGKKIENASLSARRAWIEIAETI